ncbi:MAG: hypothetical protein HY319_31775 [Armatimonadetes bacterium]|nr:hypothetical protein [Armatimonadota bacterium]
MRWLVLLLLVGVLWAPAPAEVKLINGSGDDVVLDVLSQAGSAEDVSFSAAVTPGTLVGPKAAPGTAMMTVVKTEGTEKYREGLESGNIYLLKKWNPYLFTYLGRIHKNELSGYSPRVVNGVGQPVDYEVTYKDFQVSKSTLGGPDTNSNVTFGDLGMSRNPGEVVSVTFSPADGGAPLKVDLKCGITYFLSRGADGNLAITFIGMHD